jgi:hypothetical protein
MSNPMKTLLALPELSATAFPPNSRYHGIETVTRVAADGSVQTYLRRRFVPDPALLARFDVHRVVQGDRLDLLAAAYLGDPELFWRICDGNGAMRPDELVETIGRRLRMTQPAGVPGVADD